MNDRLFVLNRKEYFFNRFLDEAYLYRASNKDCTVLTGIATDLLHLLALASTDLETLTERLNRLLVRQRVSSDVVAKALRDLSAVGIVTESATPFRTRSIAPSADIVEHIRATTREPYFYTPYAATLFINGKCNQKCEFCFLDFDLMRALHDSLTTDQWVEIIDRLTEAGIFFINIGGMEPLVSFDLTVAILRRAKAAGCVLGFITNGSIPLTPPQIEMLLEVDPHIGVSLESHVRGVHDEAVALPRAYEHCVRNVEAWVKAGLTVEIQTVAMRRNAPQIPDFVRWLDRLGVASFSLQNTFGGAWCSGQRFFDMALSPPEYQQVVARLKELEGELRLPMGWDGFPHERDLSRISRHKGHRLEELIQCSAGKTAAYVSPNGDLTPCPVTVAHPEHVVGNILTRPFLDIWHDTPAFGAFRKYRAADYASPACRSCEHFENCRGGCLITAQAANGGFLAGDPRCAKVYEYYRPDRQASPALIQIQSRRSAS
jgi:radical SAM protein with 4Fe4S-binding SPASM domain